MESNIYYINELIRKKIAGNINPHEESVIEQWGKQNALNAEYLRKGLSCECTQIDNDREMRAFMRLSEDIRFNKFNRFTKKHFLKLLIIVALIILVCWLLVWAYHYTKNSNQPASATEIQKEYIEKIER